MLPYTEEQLNAASIQVLRTRAQNLREQLGMAQRDAVLPSTREVLVDLILDMQNQSLVPARLRPGSPCRNRNCTRHSPRKAADVRRVCELGGYFLLPTEPVGSLPRPMSLQNAMNAYDRGEIDARALQMEQDAAVIDSIKGMEASGQEINTDGEQRASSFATYPLVDTLGGSGLANNLALDGGQNFAIFMDGHNRQLPRLTGGPFRYQTYAADYLARSKPHFTKKFKQAVIAPSMLWLLYPLDADLPGYSREEFEADLCNECEEDIRRCFALGAARVSIDFTEGRLACKNDPRNPWTGRGLLAKFVELNNRVIDRFSADERSRIGVHTCPGGDCDSTHSSEVDYAELLPMMFQMNAGYFLIQCASETNREYVYELCGRYSREDANGVPQVCFIGVINPQNPRVETAEEVARMLLTATQYIPKERLGATDDCGFSPFSLDVKPKHGSPDKAREIAFDKIKARIEGVLLASQRLEMGHLHGYGPRDAEHGFH